MGNYSEQELKGAIGFSFLKELIDSETREFHIRKTSDTRFILRSGDNSSVKRGDGINYLHFHPEGCGVKEIDGIFIRKEFEGLPSLNDILIMSVEGKPHMVVSKQGMSVYSRLKNNSKDYLDLLSDFPFPDLYSLMLYEEKNYDIFRSKVSDAPMRIRIGQALIEYLPWKETSLQQHDFRNIPKLMIPRLEVTVAECLLKKFV